MRQKTRKVLRLRTLRREREMSQGELGRRVGVAKSTICEIEKGLLSPSVDKARELAGVFGVTVDEAFTYVEVPAL